MKVQVVNPLSWPAGWPATDPMERKRAAFQNQRQLTSDMALRGLGDELRKLGADWNSAVLTCDAPLRADGMPRKARYRGDLLDMQPAIAVYFDLEGSTKCFPCDKWDRIEDNIRAVTLTISAIRGLERWGSKHLLDAAFQGFDALPASSTAGWWTVLGVPRDAPDNDVRSAYRQQLLQHHPDRGGDPEAFHRVQAAWQEYMERSQS